MKDGYVELTPLTEAELLELKNETWSLNESGSTGTVDFFVYYLIERVFDEIGKRYEIHSIKSIADANDPEAGDWHNDAMAWDDEGTCCTVLLYRCAHDVPLEVRVGETVHQLFPFPGRLVLVDSTRPDVQHRAKFAAGRSFVKVTLK